MGFLARLFGGSKKSQDNGLYFYIRLYHVPNKPTPQDEFVKVRVDMVHDLSLADEGDGYFIHKEVLGPKNFRRATLSLHFDNQRRLQNQEIVGGELMTKAEFEQALGQNA
jgi:hypothetical protein